MPKNYLFIILLLAQTSCTQPNLTQIKETSSSSTEQKTISIPPQPIRECVCADVWMPVCGNNGKTYSNACFAKCAGVNFHQGTCDHVIKD
jgi:hypothetical protein